MHTMGSDVCELQNRVLQELAFQIQVPLFYVGGRIVEEECTGASTGLRQGRKR